ncbi:MAG TPA: glycosyltransferase family 39 protein [Vicinamibacteria bacterium]
MRAPRVRAAVVGWGPAVVLTETFLLLASWTWGRCADPQVDYGREVYVPWRLAEGDVLYRDVHSVFGPLSPYLNAAGFRLLGTSIRSLSLLSLAVLAAIAFLMWMLLRRITSQLAATVGVMLFLCVFAFSHTVRAGSFNFVAPYRHELTHGTLLSLLALLLASRHLECARAPALAACGAALGALALTKIELFVATGGGVAAMIVAADPRPRAWARRFAILAGSAAAIFMAAVLALCLVLPFGTALRGAGATFVTATSPGYIGTPFVRLSMGLTDLGQNLRALAWWSLVYAGWAAAGTMAALLLKRWRSGRWTAFMALLVLGALWPVWPRISWADAARPLPLVPALVALACAAALRRSEGAARLRQATVLGLAVYAELMIAKIALTARTYHYGFALAPPAALLLVAVVLDWWPADLERRRWNGAVFRGAALGLLALFVYAHLQATAFQLSRQRHALGGGVDLLLGDERAAVLAGAADVLKTSAAPGDTLTVLPEGLLLNYLLRRRSPSPYVDYMPSEVAHYGEPVLLTALQRSPPDWIALVDKDTSNYGVRYFGQDYGTGLAQWVVDAYEPWSLVGPRPFSGQGFGVALLRRRGAAAGARTGPAGVPPLP